MTQMDDDRWRECRSDWRDPGSGPGGPPDDEPAPTPMPVPDDRSADVDSGSRPGTRTAAWSATGPISPRPDLGDCA